MFRANPHSNRILDVAVPLRFAKNDLQNTSRITTTLFYSSLLYSTSTAALLLLYLYTSPSTPTLLLLYLYPCLYPYIYSTSAATPAPLILCSILHFSTLWCPTHTLLYSTLLYSTLLYSALLYSTLVCSTLLFSTSFLLHAGASSLLYLYLALRYSTSTRLYLYSTPAPSLLHVGAQWTQWSLG